MHYTSADIRKAFDAATFRRGQTYHAEGRVLNLESADNGQIISGQVRGKQAQAYSTQVQLRGDKYKFSSRCSCPVGRQCKHAVALLLTALDQEPSKKLDCEINAWVDDLFAQHQSEDKQKRGSLRFDCELPEEHPEPHLAVSVTRPGREGKAMSLMARWQRGQAIDGQFRSLFNRLRGFADESPYVARLHDADSGPLLQALVETGQCYWKGVRRALKTGKPRPAKARWQVHADGSQSLGLDAGRGIAILPLEPPLYFDRRKAEIGCVTTELSSELLPLINRSPRIGAHQIEEFIDLLDARGLSGIPKPEIPRAEELKQTKPEARLSLMHIDDLVSAQDGYVPDIYVALIQADYAGHGFNPGHGETLVHRRENGELIRIHRDLAAERALLDQLSDFHEAPVPGQQDDSVQILTPYAGRSGWADFLEHQEPMLRRAGWQIEKRDSFDLRLSEPQTWQLDTVEKDDSWFELSAEIKLDGESHNLLQMLAQLLAEADDPDALLKQHQQSLIVDLGDGRLLRLPRQRIESLLHTLIELYRDKPLNRSGKLRLHKLDLARVKPWANQWQWQAPENLRAFADSLLAPIPEPILAAGFNGHLRGYQSAGLAWMQNLRSHGFSGLLADDMGLGKTVQTLAHVASLQQGAASTASLIVAPTSVLGNWRNEAHRFTPAIKTIVWHGSQRFQDNDLKSADLVITSYGTLLRDCDEFERKHWQLLVLDEAQAIKNPRAKISTAVKRLKAQQKLCLSGTPMENHLGELWSLFDFLAPGFLGDARSFKQLYRKPIEKHDNQERAKLLAQRIAPFWLRRRKEEVATELPPKSEIIQTITMDDEQAALYETIRGAMQQQVRDALREQGIERSHILILDALLKLRQVCCDPRLLKLEQPLDAPSAKMDAVLGMLEDLVGQGRRILLFSQFTEMLSLIEQELKNRHYRYLKLTGQTRNRQDMVDEFQNGDVPIFLISLKAGGTGLNLTAADTVIHYDPWWNPAAENQASDRAHRIGQDKPVFIYKLICEDSVEQRILALQNRKQALSDSLETQASLPLQAEDLEQLLQPLG